MSARFLNVAAAVCLSLSAVAGGLAVAPAAQPADTPASSASAATKSSPGAPSAPKPGDAAARHAKRTACLKNAKTQKLVGAERAAFLEACIAAP